MNNEIAPLAVSMGEPAGIGPDIILKAHALSQVQALPAFVVVGCAQTLRQRSQSPGHASAQITVISSVAEAAHAFAAGDLPVLDMPLSAAATPGRPAAANSNCVIGWIDEAARLALQGSVSGVVTGPIQKETLYASGFSHQGHTDYLAHLAIGAGHVAEPVMMLSAGSLRTVPLSVHIALKDVAAAITQEEIIKQARIISHGLKHYFALTSPRIAIAGLNPHAGENGNIGSEDKDIIKPAVEALKREGIGAFGPVAADTLFHEEARAGFDCALCMYHDQALIPVKTLGFHEGINTTLGLPFVRTSPDHGTALELAATGRANPSSFMAALKQAAAMARASV